MSEISILDILKKFESLTQSEKIASLQFHLLEIGTVTKKLKVRNISIICHHLPKLKLSKLNHLFDDSDEVTSWLWCLYDGDWFLILVTESLCWRLFSLCWLFSICIKPVINILNRSPTSHTCHHTFHLQHPSPTSMVPPICINFSSFLGETVCSVPDLEEI